MNAESLLVSAAINIGLAVIILSLFSILKKQPSNACIYYSRQISLKHYVPFDQSFTFHRLLPSLSWVSRAIRVTEDEIVETSGLDALIIIRLFKFGINFFLVCSLVGFVMLLPLNYTSHSKPSGSFHSMDSFAISNINGGSDSVVFNTKEEHLPKIFHDSDSGFHCGDGLSIGVGNSEDMFIDTQALGAFCMFVVYIFLRIIPIIQGGFHTMSFQEYNNILMKRIRQLHNNRDHPDQFTVLVREIPLCIEHKAHGCCVDHFFSKHHPYAYRSYQILYEGKNLESLLNQAKSIARKIEDLRHQSLIRKHTGEPSLSEAFRDDEKLVQLEEKLQELCLSIRNIQCKKMIEEKELPVAFVTFRSRWGAALAAQSRQTSDPLLWITEMAPEPRDVLWRNLAIPYRRVLLYKFGVFIAALLLTLFFAIPVTAVQGIAKFERLNKWFPPVKAMQLIPGLRSVVTGFLPSVILSGFIYFVPFAMLAMAKVAGYISRSKQEIKTCNMVFYFLVANVFFLSLLSGSLLDQIGESFSHPRDIPTHLASAVSAQADFFMTYILTNGLSGFSLEILQPGLFIWDTIKSHTWARGKKKNPYLYTLPYYRVIPFVCLSILIGMVYAVVTPLLLPFLIAYFLLGYVVFINQIQDVYETVYETCGQYWPHIHRYILFAIVLAQIIMIGLFGLKSKPSASFAIMPLLLLTLMFNEYCKIRFRPAFYYYPIQDAMKNDELDEKDAMMDVNYQNALDAYCPPCLRSVNLASWQPSSTLPLLSKT